MKTRHRNKPQIDGIWPLMCRVCCQLFLLVLLSYEVGGAAAAKRSPATVSNPVKETDLATITLTPEAERRLGLGLATVERRKVVRARLFGGEVIIPPRSGANATNNSSHGQVAFSVLPSATPGELMRIAEAQIESDGQVERAKVQLDTAKITQDRADKLLRDKAGSVRTLDEAKTQVGLAE